MSEGILLEVLDEQGKPVPPGEMGKAVMTGRYSQPQPFIRYRTGDMIRMSPEVSEDGRGLEMHIQIRLMDAIPPEASSKHRHIASFSSRPVSSHEHKRRRRWTCINSSPYLFARDRGRDGSARPGTFPD